MYSTENYTEQGGKKTVIKGIIDLSEATIIGNVANQAASTATAVGDLKNDFNALLTKLKAAGIMVADS